MSSILELQLVATERSFGRPRSDEIDGISEEYAIDVSEEDRVNETPIDVGYDIDDDGDSGADGLLVDEEE